MPNDWLFKVTTQTNTALIEMLKPSTEYTAQVSVEGLRDPTGSLISNPWSVSLTFTTIDDDVAPATPSNFMVELVGETFVATWDAPTTNEDGSPLDNDFKFYVLEFHPVGQEANKQTYMLFYEEEKFELPLPLNRLLFGTPQAQLVWSIRSQDLSGNESAPATMTVGGQPPDAPEIEVNASNPSQITVHLLWDNDRAVNYYSVHRSSASSFTPDDSNFIGSVSASRENDAVRSFYDVPNPGTVYYYKIVAYNYFDLSATSNEVSASTSSPVEAGPVSTPGAPTLNGGVHSITVTHNLQADAGGTLESSLRYFEVYASTTSFGSGDPASSDYIGRLPVTGSDEASTTFVWVVTDPGDSETVYVKVRAANAADGLSPDFSPQASTVVEKAEGEFFKVATIGDAYIQNLSASKILANTSFTNDLTVESVFTMADGGVMRSENWVNGEQGWYLDSTGFAELNDLLLRGNIEATSGFIENVNVRETVTVGDGAIAGQIQSSNYTGSQGWRIQSNGSVDFHSGNFRGFIGATSGFLGALSVNGQITVSSGQGSIVHSGGGYSLLASGGANFGGTVNIQSGGNLNISGSLSVFGFSNLYSTLTVQSGGIIRAGTASLNAEIRYQEVRFNNGTRTWTVNPTEQNNLLFYLNTFAGEGFAMRNRTAVATILRLQSTAITGQTQAFLDLVDADLRFRIRSGSAPHLQFSSSFNQIQVTNSSGTILYVFGTTALATPNTRNLGTAVQRWGTVYYTSLNSGSDERLKYDIAATRFGLDFIRTLSPSEYKWNDGSSGRLHHGFVAQQLKQAVEDYGETTNTFGAIKIPSVNPETEGEVDNEDIPWGLDYTELISPVVRAVQEIADKLDSIESRLDVLEG